jgi:hypothetical protein
MADVVVLSHVARRALWGLVPDLLEARPESVDSRG